MLKNYKKIKDTHNERESRNLGIKKAGVKGVAYWGLLNYGKQKIPLQGTIDCFAYLGKNKKGVHMSRIIKFLTRMTGQKITYNLLKTIALSLCNALETKCVYLNLHTAAIRIKESPLSKNIGFEEFKIHFLLKAQNGNFSGAIKIGFIGTSLCPASRDNSKYGAHNQRSLVTVKFPVENVNKIYNYLEISENQLSAKLYPIIKLEDEILITQQAYKNAKFAEDIVRDIAINLKRNALPYFKITCENFESIHTHNVYAEIVE